MPAAPHLFLDLDGVLADFDGHAIAVLGLEPATTPPAEFWKAVARTPRFWADMQPFPYLEDFWRVAREWSPTIITGLPVTKMDEAERHKRAWVARHLGPDVPVICCLSRDKPRHMRAPGDILVDDRPANVSDWVAAGGRGLVWDGPQGALSRIAEIYARTVGDALPGDAPLLVVLRARALYHLDPIDEKFDRDFVRGMAAKAYSPRPRFSPAQERHINRLAWKYRRRIDPRLVPIKEAAPEGVS